MNSLNIPIQTFNNYGTVIINDTQKISKVEFNQQESFNYIKFIKVYKGNERKMMKKTEYL